MTDEEFLKPFIAWFNLPQYGANIVEHAMRQNIARLQGIVRAIQKDGPTEDHLKQAVLLLADEVVYLSRELDSVKTTATRAERNARMMGVLR